MDKQELIKFLKDNLRIKIETEMVEGNYYRYTGENRLKVSLVINGEDYGEDDEIDYTYITKDQLDFVNRSEI